MKLMTVVGTRPEIIRLSRIIPALDVYFKHILVHTGQNYDYELNQIFFEDLEIRKPDYFLEAAGSNSSETVSNIISKTDTLLKEVEPDALLILGDTNSCLSAYPTKRRHIPIFHMEAGNRCFDQRVPEEINRKIVDHLADINMPYSDISREYLLREGFPADQIIKTGSPMYEVLMYYLEKSQNSDILNRLNLKHKDYFIVSSHREENISSLTQLKKFKELLNNLAIDFDKKIIVTTHPRTRKALEGYTFNTKIELHKPFNLTDFIKLEMNAFVTLSDSGTISEESNILNFPALNIREAHERPEAMEEGAVIMTGINYDVIKESLKVIESQNNFESILNSVNDYLTPNVSEKVVRIILSYTNYIKRKVYRQFI